MIAWGTAFGLAGELLRSDDLRTQGEPLVAAALDAQRSDGAVLMGTPRGPDTHYQGMALRRLAWWLLRTRSEAADRALALGATWLAEHVSATGDVDVNDNVKSAPLRSDDDVAWALVYDGILHGGLSLDAAARLLHVPL
jgi:hypothetical protein